MKKYIFYIAIVCLVFSCSRETTKDEYPPLFPFLIEMGGEDNIADMSYLLDAPAGKNGFVRIENGRFVTDAGPIRLHGTNLTGAANFPDHKDADLLATELAGYGINCVRLHYFDANYGNFRNEKQAGIFTEDSTTQRNLDPEQLDRLDYMISKFKEKGIYVNINLHVARKLDERDGFSGFSQRPGLDKGVDNFEPRMIELQKEYAKDLLTHVNPYTNLPYTDDPCVALIEINNENALLNQYHRGGIDRLPEPYIGELQSQWNVWLRNKYSTTQALLKAWNWQEVPLHDEQIEEGGFEEPVSIDGKTWRLSEGNSSVICNVEDNALKINVTREGDDYFPKLFRKLKVKKGKPYTLTFKIRKVAGNVPSTLGLAVSDVNNGWKSQGLHQTIEVEKMWKEFSISFTATDDSGDTRLELTRFSTGVYEIDDLSFKSGTIKQFDMVQRVEDGTVPVIKKDDFTTLEARKDFYQFLIDTEHEYWVGMSNYLKNELGVKSVISGTQLGYSPPFVQSELDYIDSHAYWCHPSPVNENWRIRNESMVNSMATIKSLASQRILGKPYTVSEYNHPFPNQYGAEGQPMLRSYGAFQGWDGVFEYTFNHRNEFDLDYNNYFFSINDRTDVLAHFPACATIYLRGDVRESKSTISAPIDYAGYFEKLVSDKSVGANISDAGFDTSLSLIHKTGVLLNGDTGSKTSDFDTPTGKILKSDTEELIWNREIEGKGYFVVNAPNTKLFTGFPEGRKILLDDIELSVGNTRLGWATVSLVSRNANGFSNSETPIRILVAATGLIENNGMKIKELDNNHITLTDWGKAPVYVEGIPVTLSLASDPKKTKCFALNPKAKRKKEIPVTSIEGKTVIQLKPEYKTIWYEIEIK
jgi:hypothetical protein